MTTVSVVRIDDSHPNLLYSGPWEAVNGALYDHTVSSGHTFRATLRSLTKEGSVELTFNGGGGGVWGTISPTSELQYPSHRVDGYPTVACYLDGTQVATLTRHSPPFPLNNFPFCTWSAASSVHTLTINISYPEATPFLPSVAPFLLDYIDFSPSVSQRLDNETTGIPINDPSIIFGGVWTRRRITSSFDLPATNVEGSTVQIPFNGTGVLVQGARIPSSLGISTHLFDPAAATYLLDGQDPGSFVIQSNSSNPIEENTFIEVTDLPLGMHDLKITYHGNETTLPFILTRVFVYRDIHDPVLHTISTPIPPEPSSSRIPKGAIVGAIVGGIFLVLSLACGAWLVLRERRRRWKERDSEDRDCSLLPGPCDEEGEKPPIHPGLSSVSTSSPQTYLDPSSSTLQLIPPSKFAESNGFQLKGGSTASASSPTTDDLSSFSDASPVAHPPRLPIEVIEHPPLYTPT